MSKMVSKSSIVNFFIIWFTYAAIFGFITIVIRENGYLNFEPSFITNHINTLFYKDELVKNFFLTYPVLSNALAYPFSIFSALDAPFFASVFYTSFFTAYVVTAIGKQRDIFMKIILFFYFLVSPVTIYAATSGTSVYIFYILFFLVFYQLLSYVKQFTTYYIAILSILLSFAVLLHFEILWILLLLFFYVFVFSIYSIKGLWSANLVTKYIRISQNISLRRKFRGHFFSMIFIIGFFPLSGLALYLFTNYLIGDDYFYFLKNLESKWNGNSFFNILNVDNITSFKNRAVNDFSFTLIIIYIMPMFIFEIISHYKEGLKVFILLLVPLLLFVLLKDHTLENMSLANYTIIIAAAIASITATKNKLFRKRKIIYPCYIAIFILSVVGEFIYFSKSNFTLEKTYYQSVVAQNNNTFLEELKNGGLFLASNTPKNTVILCDKSIYYTIVAFNKKHNTFIFNSSLTFKKAITNPQKNCDYIIVSNISSPYYNYDKINAKLNRELSKNRQIKNYKSEIIYFCNTFKILKILK